MNIYICKVCGKQFGSRKFARQHVKEVHNVNYRWGKPLPGSTKRDRGSAVTDSIKVVGE